MTDLTTQHARPAVRASDAERDQAIALLQRSFADGRLTQAELEERASAAYTARTRAQLRDLTADLPTTGQQPPRPRMVLDQRLLIIPLCACPPAGLAYWLLCLRRTAQLRARLRNARPWQQLLAAAIAVSAGAALQITSGHGQLAVLGHLAGAVLVSAGVIVSLPASSRLLHRTWIIVRRALPVRGSQHPQAAQPGPGLVAPP
jgi:Domain of unknown function (DUF1707)